MDEDTADVITFLYTLTRGMASRSYGLNVARLADIPSSIVTVAGVKSRELEECVQMRRYILFVLQSFTSSF